MVRAMEDEQINLTMMVGKTMAEGGGICILVKTAVR